MFRELPKAAGGEKDNGIGTQETGDGHKDKVDGRTLESHEQQTNMRRLGSFLESSLAVGDGGAMVGHYGQIHRS